MTGDRVDRAIEAVAAEERTVTLARVPITIASSGRPAFMDVPIDLTDAETMELAAFVLMGLRPFVSKATGQRSSGLIVPRPT